MCVHESRAPCLSHVKCCPDLQSFDLFSFSFTIEGISLEKRLSTVLIVDKSPPRATHTPHAARLPRAGVRGWLWHTQAGSRVQEVGKCWPVELWRRCASSPPPRSTRPPAHPEVVPLSASEYPYYFGGSVFTTNK